MEEWKGALASILKAPNRPMNAHEEQKKERQETTSIDELLGEEGENETSLDELLEETDSELVKETVESWKTELSKLL